MAAMDSAAIIAIGRSAWCRWRAGEATVGAAANHNRCGLAAGSGCCAVAAGVAAAGRALALAALGSCSLRHHVAQECSPRWSRGARWWLATVGGRTWRWRRIGVLLPVFLLFCSLGFASLAPLAECRSLALGKLLTFLICAAVVDGMWKGDMRQVSLASLRVAAWGRIALASRLGRLGT